MPSVSVVIPSYNHGKFVIRCVESALKQTHADLEVIVVDDGSPDGSADLLRQVADPRFRLIAFPQNRGAAEATNTGIKESRGDFVAILNSDDQWLPTKLERQLEVFGKNPGVAAVFTSATFIDSNDRPFPPGKLAFDGIFDQENRSRGRWIRRLLFEGNCLCHPSLLIRRSVYDSVGLYDGRFRQLPDLQMWVRLCQAHDIHVIPEKLVLFRILEHEQNVSSPNIANKIRMANETAILAEDFFRSLDVANFVDGFSDLLRRPVADELDARIEQAFILGSVPNELSGPYASHATRLLFDLLGDEASAGALRERYGFGEKQFHAWMADHDPFLASRRTFRSFAREILFRVPGSGTLIKAARAARRR